ncbi:hypothetical protein PG988_006686 [Apiospora saccharicola]
MGVDGGWACWGTRGKLDHIKERLDSTRVRSADYGLGDAHVVVFNDGACCWDLLDQYPDLEELLEEQNNGDVIFVAMNPYRGNEYFVVLANVEVHIRASAIVERDVVNVLEAYPNMEVISSTLVTRDTTVGTQVGLPKQARRREFLRGIATSVAGGAASALVTAAFGACNVM